MHVGRDLQFIRINGTVVALVDSTGSIAPPIHNGLKVRPNVPVEVYRRLGRHTPPVLGHGHEGVTRVSQDENIA
ncbi:hypothetical protein, partial [Mycolicibacter minnesotensis]|uniref:hypothetical protein n=1 Tax=Mycolicibacter minnesotensis TaxID=1118379 RepID=UPI003908AA05